MEVKCFLPEVVYSVPELLVEVKVDEKARVWINGRESSKIFIPLEYGKNRIEICVKTKKEFKKIEKWVLNLRKEEHEFDLQEFYEKKHVTLMEVTDAFKIKTEWIASEKTINLYLAEDVYSLVIDSYTLMHNNVEEPCEPIVILNDKAMITEKTAEIFGVTSVFNNKLKITHFTT
jgi:hypothetical protein